MTTTQTPTATEQPPRPTELGTVVPDTAGSEAAGSEAAGSEAAGSEAAGSEAAGSEAAGSEAIGSETVGPKTGGPDTAGPKAAVPDTAGPDTAEPRTAVPDTAGPERAGSEAVGSEAGATGAEMAGVAGASARAVPRTAPGAFLRATAINHVAGREIRPDYESRVFFYCAFELAVRRRFRHDTPVMDIARSVNVAARRHALVALPPLEAEMLVRDALGEAVPIEGIPLTKIVAAHVVIFAALADEMGLTDDELDALIAEAEDQAGALGHPPDSNARERPPETGVSHT